MDATTLTHHIDQRSREFDLPKESWVTGLLKRSLLCLHIVIHSWMEPLVLFRKNPCLFGESFQCLIINGDLKKRDYESLLVVYSYLPPLCSPFPKPSCSLTSLFLLTSLAPLHLSHVSGPLSSSPANLLLYPPCGWSASNNDSWSSVEILFSVTAKKRVYPKLQKTQNTIYLFRNRKVLVAQSWPTLWPHRL